MYIILYCLSLETQCKSNLWTIRNSDYTKNYDSFFDGIRSNETINQSPTKLLNIVFLK